MQWGILGSGKIAGKFATQLADAQDQTLVAVGSRGAESAERFAAAHACDARVGYEQLLADDRVAAVYLSLPNSMHHEWTIRALQAGKHVLCEKPIASNRGEAVEMFAEAKKQGRVLVEAFMYRTQPIIRRLLRTIHDGEIGDVRLIRSHFTFQREADANDVRYQADLAGGCLMDVGCYCINLARAITRREPDQAHAIAHAHPFGVEDYAAGNLKFGDALAVFTCGMTVQADRTTFIGGETGFIRIDTPWFSEGEFDIVRPDGTETVREPSEIGPYALEAEAFARVIEADEPPWITEADSLGNMQVLDQLRAQLA